MKSVFSGEKRKENPTDDEKFIVSHKTNTFPKRSMNIIEIKRSFASLGEVRA
jgi:hypothetical protein